MALLKHLRLILAVAPLVASLVIDPAPRNRNRQKRAEDNDDTPLPLVIWHGLGDNYANPGLRQVAELAEEINPGTLVYTIRLDEDPSRDRSATFLGNVTEQLAQVCGALAAHPILSTAPAIDAVGFSQGGQFLRGYVERCNSPPVRSLVTFGSQHNGISSFRACSATDWVCRGSVALLRGRTWSAWAQSQVVPAQYFRDPADYDKYLEHSNFLADINNEREAKNETYRANVAALENLVLFLFEEDTTVIPKETAWFEEVNGTEITPLRARKLYSEDWIGLRELDRKGGLKFRSMPGDHMQLSEKVLNETFREYFGTLKKARSAPTLGDDEL